MKRNIAVLCLTTLLVIACNIPSFVTPTATEPPLVLPTSTVDTGNVVTLNNVSFTLPLGVANDALTEMVSAASEAEADPWAVAPAHLKFELTGYQVQDKFHKPQIFVYPADEYAQANPAASEEIQRVKDIIAGAVLSPDAMPHVPFFNAAQQIASQMQVIDFKNGRGVRFLTQYAQYLAPINNYELFYHFQGLTTDGRYYIIATLPVTSSVLPEDEKPESPVPAGGVPLPADGMPGAEYYESVTKVLDSMYPDSFNPSLFQLDALIQSITITLE